jgi:hypothetical protein
MRYLQKSEDYKNSKLGINEAVIKMGNDFKVKSNSSIPQSFINSYVKSVKEATGKDLKEFYSDMDLSEMIVNYVMENFLKIESIPTNAFTGGDEAPKAEDDTTGAPVEETPVAEAPVEETPGFDSEEIETTSEELPA